jgi:aryl-alcohol dehydrogenase-like predicted oxidoreductase
MRYRPLGRTGLFVSELCLGTMTFGGSEGLWGVIGKLQQSEAEHLVGQALDAGINFIVHGVSVAQVALAWLLHQPQVTTVIVGARRLEQLADNIAATQVTLTEIELQEIGNTSRLPSEYPGWMFGRQGEYRRKQVGEALSPRR